MLPLKEFRLRLHWNKDKYYLNLALNKDKNNKK